MALRVGCVCSRHLFRGSRPLSWLGRSGPDRVLGYRLLLWGPVRGGGGHGRGWWGVRGDRCRRALERPLLAYGDGRGPVTQGRTIASGPGRPDNPYHLLGPSDQRRRALRQGVHDRCHRTSVRHVGRRDGRRRSGPRRRRGGRREARAGRDLSCLLLGPADRRAQEWGEAYDRRYRDSGGPDSSPRPDRTTWRTGARGLRSGVVGLEGGILVSALWFAIVAVTLATAAFKAAGPILAGGRELPPRVNAVMVLLTPALLTALVVTGTFGEGGHLELDEKALGVGVAAVALALRTPVIVAVVLAAVVTALARLFLG